MSPDEYRELVEFLGPKFDRIDERFDGIDERLVTVEVGLEATRDDIRQLAEGLTSTNERIDRVEESLRREMREGFSGLRNLIAATYGQLDTRISRLEAFHADELAEG